MLSTVPGIHWGSWIRGRRILLDLPGSVASTSTELIAFNPYMIIL
jgi:hypothetical protein